ncbi:hypothetical protein [Helicobacter canadensis]|nr:hypothetical protein [Helicobacter canadensis]
MGIKKITDLKEVYDLSTREKKEWLKEDIESRNKEIYQRLYEFFTKHI